MKKRIRKIVGLDREAGGQRPIERSSISTSKLKRKVINNLICSPGKEGKRATSEPSKPAPRPASKTAPYSFSRPKKAALKEGRQFLANPRVLKAYNNEFLDFMFRTKTEEDRSEPTLLAESGCAWENYLAGRREEEKKYRSIEGLKVGRQKTVGFRW